MLEFFATTAYGEHEVQPWEEKVIKKSPEKYTRPNPALLKEILNLRRKHYEEKYSKESN